MIGSLVVMVGTRDAAASVGAGLALIVVAMSMAVAARRSHRAFIHVLDLLAMGTATVVGCMSGSDDMHASGGMAGMPGHSAGMALPFAIAIVVAWGVVRIALACAWRRPALWMAATGALTGGCLCVMFVV